MATLTTATMTKKDTLVTIKIRDDCKWGLSFEGKEYYAGQTVTLPAFWAARWIGNGRAEQIDEEPSPTPFGAIDNRDPVEARGRRGR